MKKIFVMVTVLASALMISCTSGNKNADQLKKENDSLMQVNAQTKADFEEMLQTLNEVEDGFKQMKEAENYLIVQQNATGDMDKSTREKLGSDMQLITQTLKENKERLAKLQEQVKSGKYQSAQFKQTIERLTAEIESKTAMITSLQEDLAKRDVRIKELDEAVAGLSDKVTNLSQQTEEQQGMISTQDKELNTVYYAYGTSKELKEQKIITGGGLFKSKEVMKGDFNKSYFTKGDLRTLKQIPLEMKKAKLLTNHPEGSYTFVKGADNLLTLDITNPEKFWSLSKFLVIQVD